MQDLLRQWGNTAELCSLCCQRACKEEEGERACTGGGGVRERERERESANNVILFRRQCCSQLCRAMKAHHQRLRVSAEKFSSSPPRVRCYPRLLCRYTFISSLVLSTLCVVSLCAHLFARDSTLLKSALQELIYVCRCACLQY